MAAADDASSQDLKGRPVQILNANREPTLLYSSVIARAALFSTLI